ncbi:MAG: aminotransferase class V-fold PLP-dependent enzyme [Nitrospinae bacterium]|nr:aminotransferase class V-fold PLP-dependent enzyme [Nitrospinota bacterium]
MGPPRRRGAAVFHLRLGSKAINESPQNPKFLNDLGMRRVISARTRQTVFGGSKMRPEVWAAMREANAAQVDMNELHAKAGARIAGMTQNEAAYVTSGSAAGLVLCAAACITGRNPALMDRLPFTDGLKNEIVIHRFQRNHYDINIRQAGARLVEIGSHRQTHPWELEEAIGEKTAGIFYFPGRYAGGNILKLETIIEIAHEKNVPVVVDAAAQLPPSSNLWRYTREMGADAAIFSGGKSIGGPQNTGIILGRKEIVEACAMMGSPRYSVGRPMKAGRDDIVGLLCALDHYLDGGETDQYAHNERWCEFYMERMSGMKGLSPRVRRPNSLGQDLPEVVIEIDPETLGKSRDAIVDALWACEVRVQVGISGESEIFLSPDPLTDADAEYLWARLVEVVS